MISASIYDALTGLARARESLGFNERAFRRWVEEMDNGPDPTWAKFDEMLDEFVQRFREAKA